MDNRRLIDAVPLKAKLQEKIDTLNKRIEVRNGPCYFDESEAIASFHSEAYVYEQVIKMIDELSDPIPPTIKPGDKTYHKKYKEKCEVKELFNNSKKALVYWLEGAPTYYVNLVNVEDLEVIGNE